MQMEEKVNTKMHLSESEVTIIEKLDVNKMAVFGTYPHRARSVSFQLVSLHNGSLTSKTCLSLLLSRSYTLFLDILTRN